MEDSAGGRSAGTGRVAPSGEDIELGLLLTLDDAERLGLQVEHRPVPAAERNQLVVRTKLHHLAVLDHTDPVGVPDGRETVRDKDCGAVAGGVEDAVEDLGFAAHVELGGRFVEQNEAGTQPDRAQRPGQRDALPSLSGAPAGATLSRKDSSKRVKSWNTAVTRPRQLARSSWRRSTPSTSIAPACGSYNRHNSLANVVLPDPLRPTMASDDPAGIVRSKCSRTGRSPDGYANVTARKRISAAGSPSAGRGATGCGRAPAGAMAESSRRTAATGAAAPSSAQLSPPNAIMLVPTAA